jgi:uncharacterized protein (DUF1501 family)
MDDNALHTRRRFLHRSMLGAATSLTIPAFLESTMNTLHAESDSKPQTATGKENTILVVLQLAGGNDGLNTVVPHGDDVYYQSRPNLGIKADQLLKINDHLGLNDNLSFFNELYQDGQLGIVQGVGYPNPNRSHFRSTEIWQTATDANAFAKTGWLGRYFDHACSGTAPNPTTGVAITQQQPQSFMAAMNPGISVSQPDLYRWIQGRNPDEMAESFFREFNQPDEDAMMEGSGDSISEVSGGSRRSEEGNLDFLERVALDAQVSSDHILKLAQKHKGGGPAYPGSKLGKSLKLVSQMIAGGLDTRVFYVSHGGFDTHNNQANSHGRLLKELNDAVQAFTKDLKRQGNFDRVLLMTFSEFGRRVGENDNNGTDHGAAAPLFVIGGGVKGGLYGTHPSLTELHRGDLKFTVDFRSAYATVLDNWLKSPVQKIIGKPFEKLGFLG